MLEHPDACVVWLGDIRTDRFPEGLLDTVELARRDALRLAADRSRFALGAGLVRLIAARASGVDPREIVVDRACPRCGGPHGRPRLRGMDINVSVSHSGDLVGVAATRVGPVGLDIEAVGGPPEQGTVRLCLSDEEPMATSSDFYTYWCRKESAVKATGDGLAVPLTQVVVSPAGEPARLVSYGGRRLPASMHDVAVRPGYAAALTVLTNRPVEVALRPVAQLHGDPAISRR